MTKRITLPVFTIVAIAGLLTKSPAHADWTRFRGPNGSGIGTSDAPTQFSAERNMKWQLELPGRGISSPIVVGDRVFVTCYSGYGMGDNRGEIEDLRRHLLCVDRKTGKLLWSNTLKALMPEDPYRPPGVTSHGYASNTPVSDGRHVFAFFGKSGVYAYDLQGQEIWHQSMGREQSGKGFGSAASPIINGNQLIVNAADESLAVVWLDKNTGKELFRAQAGGLSECWTTPVVIRNGDYSETILSVIGEIWALNNANGKLRWVADGVNARNAQVSAVVDNGIVYATGEEAYAVRSGGKGDVSAKNTIWQGRVRTRYATPVVVDGHLYSVSGSVIECVNAKNGERVYQERLPATGEQDSGRRDFGGGGFGFQSRGRRGGGGGRGGEGYASPVVANGKIYVTTDGGIVHVVEAKPEFKVIASNDLTFDRSGFGATPAVSDGCLFLRSHTHLYCVGPN